MQINVSVLPFAWLVGLVGLGVSIPEIEVDWFSGNIIYVDQTATGSNTGENWANAFTSFHDALTVAEDGDTLWIAQGVYFTNEEMDRNISFQLASSISLFGGFDGTEVSLSERNWESNPTILDGDIGILGDSTDNTRQLLKGEGLAFLEVNGVRTV